jgi:hypothetical protein
MNRLLTTLGLAPVVLTAAFLLHADTAKVSTGGAGAARAKEKPSQPQSANQGSPAQVFGMACDSTLHDAIASRQYRSPTDCEVKFDDHLRNGLLDAVKPAIQELQKAGWSPFQQPSIDRMAGLARDYKVYRMESTARHEVVWQLERHSEVEETQYRNKREDEILANPALDANHQNRELMATQWETLSNDYVQMSASVNLPADAVSYMKPLTTHALAATGFAFSTNDTDDNEEGQTILSPYKTFLYLGPTHETTVQNRDGSSTLKIDPVFDANAPALAAQVIKITIVCDPKLGASILSNIDLHKLQDLIYKGSH